MRAKTSTISHGESRDNHGESHDQGVPIQSMQPEIGEQDAPGAAFLQRAGVRQLVKFCLVGASSTVIDKGSAYVMMGLGERFAPTVPWWIWTSISFCLGVTNGYFWNRRWTFQATGAAHASAGAQYRKFLLTNAIGYLLNQGFTKLFLIPITGQIVHSANPDKKHVLLASLCAVPIVVIWNFCAAKFWTFRKTPAA